VPVAQNLSGHGMHRRISIPGVKFRDHRCALLPPRLLVFVSLQLSPLFKGVYS
jgi:hypothetical protein